MLNNRLIIVIALVLPLAVIGGLLVYNAVSNNGISIPPSETTVESNTGDDKTTIIVPDISGTSDNKNDESEDTTSPPSTNNKNEDDPDNHEPAIGEDNVNLDISDNETPVKDPNPSASADEVIYGTKGED